MVIFSKDIKWRICWEFVYQVSSKSRFGITHLNVLLCKKICYPSIASGNYWVRVAFSTWNVLRLWNRSEERPQKQVQKVIWKFANNLREQQRKRKSIRMLMLKVASPNGLNSMKTSWNKVTTRNTWFTRTLYCVFILSFYSTCIASDT